MIAGTAQEWRAPAWPLYRGNLSAWRRYAVAWRYYYDILGVAPTASADQLTRAYRRLAGKYSPELNATADAASRWGRISEAYAVLSDPAKRRLYDQYGPAAVSGKGGAAAREAGRSRR